MTIKRKDKHSTQFGLWLRDQQEIDSNLGYQTTNIDYLWKLPCGRWFFIEEKRYMSQLKEWQIDIFKNLQKCSERGDPRFFLGFFVIKFENTNPEDGDIFLNGKLTTKEQLIEFLKTGKLP